MPVTLIPKVRKLILPRFLSLMQADSVEDSVTYFQQVRINKHADWTWFMSSGKILLRDEKKSPVLCITKSFAIDAMHHMA